MAAQSGSSDGRRSLRSLRHCLLASCIVLAGCGASSTRHAVKIAQGKSPGRLTGQRVATTGSSSAASGRVATMRTIAIETFSGSGTRYTVDYDFTPLAIGKESSIPTVVLEACKEEPAQNAAMGASDGQLVIHYLEGQYPLQAVIEHAGTEEATGHLLPQNQAEPPHGFLAFEQQGSWQCFETQEPGLTLQPRSTATLPVWLLVDSLDNEHPAITSQDRDEIKLETRVSAGVQGTEALSGPQVATCESSGGSEKVVLPFAKLPVTASRENTTTGEGYRVTCK
jgi:hypothetical protein